MQPPAPVRRLANDTIRQLLATDPASRRDLAALDGRSLAVTVLPTDLQVAVQIRDGGVELVELALLTEPDVEIRGSASALRRLLAAPESASASGVDLRGDASLLIQLGRVFERLDIDFEALLANWTGELPANLASRAAAAGREFGREGLHTIEEQVKAQLATRQPVLDRPRFERLRGELRALQLRTDRLEARLRNRVDRAGRNG